MEIEGVPHQNQMNTMEIKINGKKNMKSTG